LLSPDKKQAKKKKSEGKVGKYQRVFINIGRKEVAGVVEFIDFISFFGEVDRKVIGEVELQDKHTFFDVDHKLARTLVKRFTGASWEGRSLRMNFDNGPEDRGKFSKKKRKGGSKRKGNFKKKRRAKR